MFLHRSAFSPRYGPVRIRGRRDHPRHADRYTPEQCTRQVDRIARRAVVELISKRPRRGWTGLDLADPLQAMRPVGEIAARNGMLNAPHFSQNFRAEYGMTPSEYRRRALRLSSCAVRKST
ncbi:helix-turn-helix domain-containing protein (plasmid) [Rhodococcus koreensis]|nr:helix-turn-helix domain-containing protein [Rhodococcus koreensis]